MLHPLKLWFHERKHEKIIHLRERLRLAQVIIINHNMMKLSLEGERGEMTKAFGLDTYLLKKNEP